MGRARNPERDKSLQRFLESGGKISLDELAEAAGVPKSRISKWNDYGGGLRKKEGSRVIIMPGGEPRRRTGIKTPLLMGRTQRWGMRIYRRRKQKK